MKLIMDKIIKLIDLKTIITIAMVSVFLYICISSKIQITNEQFVPLIVMVLTFYFAKPKKNNNE